MRRLEINFYSREVTRIGKDVFKNCPAYITVHPDNPFYASENGKLTVIKTKPEIPYIRDKNYSQYEIEQSVKSCQVGKGTIIYPDNEKFFGLLFAKTYDEDVMFDFCKGQCCHTFTVEGAHLFADMNDDISIYQITFDEAKSRISRLVKYFKITGWYDVEYFGKPTSIRISFGEAPYTLYDDDDFDDE